MPRISVIVPAYNVAAYLERCLDSLKAQTFEDWEAIVVDDCSTDASGAIADSYAQADSRFRVIHHDENRGLHLARKTGVEAATGEWAFLLDGDDEFAPEFLAELDRATKITDADVIHVGITVVGENGVTDDAARSFASFVNHPSGVAEGADVLLDIFDESHGQLVDWRATQRLYKTDLLKRAFAVMTSERLERAEDGYEVFVISDMARRSVGFEQCRGYVYHYGVGVTGASGITAARFGDFCRQFGACIDATAAYAVRDERPELVSSFVGMRHKMLELLANDLLDRVPVEEWDQAAAHLADIGALCVTVHITLWLPESSLQRTTGFTCCALWLSAQRKPSTPHQRTAWTTRVSETCGLERRRTFPRLPMPNMWPALVPRTFEFS